MKTIFSILTILAILMAIAARPNPQTETCTPPYTNGTNDFDVSSLNMTFSECKIACDLGADAFEAICLRLPLRLRMFCWPIAKGLQTPTGQITCIAFCDLFF